MAPHATPGVLPLRLAFRGPYAARQLFDHLQRRALTGIEEVSGEPGVRTYRRTLRLPNGTGIAEVDEAAGDGWLECRLRLTELRDLTTASQRVRRLFDLDADPYAVAERLAEDPVLARLVAERPGLRSPGAAAPDELAVRAVLGQQVSVAAGRTLGAALVAAYGEPLPEPSGALTHLFPRIDDLAGASLAELGMPESRRTTLRTLGAALADGTVTLDTGADRDEAERALLGLRGIGPWTAGYIRMRALGDPDVLLTGDVAVRAGMRAGRSPDGRSGSAVHTPGAPRWRSYAMHHFWNVPRHTAGAHPPIHYGKHETMTLYTTLDSPLGELLLVGEESATAPGGTALASLTVPGQKGGATVQDGWTYDPEAFAEIARQLRAYFDGKLTRFGIEYAPTRGTDFQRRVWKALEAVPYGTTTTYGAIAADVGAARGAVRAVGTAIGANPLLVVRPCHRVIAADGSLSGYAAGPVRKRQLLGIEGVAPDAG